MYYIPFQHAFHCVDALFVFCLFIYLSPNHVSVQFQVGKYKLSACKAFAACIALLHVCRVHFIALHCCMHAECIALHCELHYTALWHPLHCTALHCILASTALHCIKHGLQCIAACTALRFRMHCTAFPHALHCNALQHALQRIAACNAMRCSLHCIALCFDCTLLHL